MTEIFGWGSNARGVNSEHIDLNLISVLTVILC